MRILKKLAFWSRKHQPFETESSVSLEARLGALEYEYERLSHDVSMVLLPETRKQERPSQL